MSSTWAMLSNFYSVSRELCFLHEGLVPAQKYVNHLQCHIWRYDRDNVMPTWACYIPIDGIDIHIVVWSASIQALQLCSYLMKQYPKRFIFVPLSYCDIFLTICRFNSAVTAIFKIYFHSFEICEGERVPLNRKDFSLLCNSKYNVRLGFLMSWKK